MEISYWGHEKVLTVLSTVRFCVVLSFLFVYTIGVTSNITSFCCLLCCMLKGTLRMKGYYEWLLPQVLSSAFSGMYLSIID